MPVFDCQKTDEVKNPKRGGRLLGDGQPVRLARLCETGSGVASASPKIKSARERMAKTILFSEGDRL